MLSELYFGFFLRLSSLGSKMPKSLPPSAPPLPVSNPSGRTLLQYLQQKIPGHHPDQPGLGQPACPVTITVA